MSWIEAFEEEAERRAAAAAERQRKETERVVDDKIRRVSDLRVREVRERWEGALNTKHFEPALERALNDLMRERVLEARKKSRDYLRHYSDADIAELLRSKDAEEREAGFDVDVTGPEFIQGAVVHVVTVELQHRAYRFYVCPKTGRIT